MTGSNWDRVRAEVFLFIYFMDRLSSWYPVYKTSLSSWATDIFPHVKERMNGQIRDNFNLRRL